MIPEPKSMEKYELGITKCGRGISESSPELQSNADQLPDYADAFRKTYLREFGFDLTRREIIVDDLRVRAVAKSPG